MIVKELAELTRPADAEKRSNVPTSVAALLLLGLIITGVFGRACAQRFVDWDDRINISLNPDLNPPSIGTLAKYWLSPQLGMYIPVVYTAWGALAKIPHQRMVNADGSTLDPAIFHTANLIVHLFCSFMVWQILRRLLPASPRRDWAAMAGATLFALHPLQVEPVAWVTGLKDLLSGLFALAALFLYILALENSEPGRLIRRWICFCTSTVFYAAALLSKPSAVCVPLMAVVIAHLVFHRPWKNNLWLIATWSAMAIVLVIVTQRSQVDRLLFRPSWQLRPFVALDAIGFYLGKFCLPIRLGIDQGRSPLLLVANGTLRWSWIPGLIFCLGIWLSRRRFPGVIAPALLCLAGFAPTLGLAPFEFQKISTVADRFAYLAMLGPALGLAKCMIRYASLRAWATGCTILISLAAISFLQVAVWDDDFSLISQALRVNPQSEVMTEKMGTAFSNGGNLDKGDELYRKALMMRWDDVAAIVGLAGNMHKRHRLQEAAAYLARAILIDPQNADARFNYGNVLFDERDLNGAISQYRLALELRSPDPRTLVNLGTALAMSGSWIQSEIIFREALDVAPESAIAHSGLGRVLEQRGDPDGALGEYQRALSIDPALLAAIKGRLRLLRQQHH
jgi:tetratricopeptide (TPR) repeat protein